MKKSDRQCDAKKCHNESAVCYSWDGTGSYRFCNKHNEAFCDMPGTDMAANAKRMTQMIIYKTKAKSKPEPKPEPKSVLAAPSSVKAVPLVRGQQKLGD
jgi:hypothetical protein